MSASLHARVTDRLKVALNIKSDSALAAELSLSRNALANRNARHSLPWNAIVDLALRKGISLDALVREKSPLLPEELNPELAATQRVLAAWWKQASKDERTWMHVSIERMCNPPRRPQ